MNNQKLAIISTDYEMQPRFEFESKIYNDNLNHLLISMMNHVINNINSSINYDAKLFCSSIDEALLKIRDQFALTNNINYSNNDVNVILCTDLHFVGGHSRVAMTFKSDNVENYYIITDILNHYCNNKEKIDFLNKTIGVGNYLLLTNGTPADKLIQIISEILKLSPKYLSCFNHQFDPICILSALIFKNCKRFFYHHCDHTASIGATIKEFIHIDTNDYINSICRENIIDSFTLPLSISAGEQFESNFDSGLPISFISAGAHHKYDFQNINSSIYYPKIVALLLLNSNTIFFHVGDLFENDLKKIFAILDANSISTDRFRYLGNIASIRDIFSRISNKIFIPSFPRGGGLTFVEFLSISAPVLLYQKSTLECLSDKSFESLINASILTWETESDLILGANKIWSDYSSHSSISNQLFKKKFSNEIYKFYLNKIFQG